MGIIVYIIYKIIITLRPIYYSPLIIIQTQLAMSEVYLICITIINQSKQH